MKHIKIPATIIFCIFFSHVQAKSINWNLKIGQSGHATNLFLERALHGPHSLALGYRKIYGSFNKKKGFYIDSNLHQYSLQFARFLSGEQFKDGASLRASLTYTSMRSKHEILYAESKSGRRILSAGEKKLGHGLALGYDWYWDSLHISLQSELIRIGHFQAWSPLSFWLGLLF